MKYFWISLISYLTIIIKGEECSPKIDSFCYSFFNSSKAFTEAEQECRQFLNGHLTSIHDILINDVVGDYAKRYGMDKFWIGGNELIDKEKWTWTDGSLFDFNDWAQGEPDLLPGFQCIYVDTFTKLWYTKDCFDSIPYVCKIPADSYFSTPGGGQGSSGTTVSGTTGTVPTGLPVTGVTQSGSTSGGGSSSGGTVGSTISPLTSFSTSSATVTSSGTAPSNPSSTAPSQVPSSSTPGHVNPSSGGTVPPSLPTSTPPSPTNPSPGTVCKFGWTYFAQTHSCYKNTTNKYTLENAEKICASAGAKLASIENAAEYGFFNQTMEYFWYWIGLCSTDNSKTWKWIDGKPVTFTRWCPNAPFPQDSSCVVTNPKMYCFTNMQKSSMTYGMCKKPATILP